ncbi:MAG: PH domain-containing protein [Allosphingosinicella sp.]
MSMQSDDLPVKSDGSAGNAGMKELHPNQLWVIRIRGLIAVVPLILAALVVDFGPLRATKLPLGLAVGLVLVLAVLAMFVLPPRHYRAWGYREEEDELHVRSGLWVRLRTVVPFGRVQHIDVAQGPVERRFGLATLILHTAGTRGSSVPLPGLLQAEAEGMRDRIRGKIRQDFL